VVEVDGFAAPCHAAATTSCGLVSSMSS
jgi:hypothetical protein